MKNIIILICILILYSNCSYLKVYKFVQNREVEFYDNKITFNLVNNRIFLKDSLNYFLDLGASSTLNINSKHKFQFKDSVEVGKIVNYRGEKLKNKIYLLNYISTPLFQAKNFYLSQWKSSLSCNEYYDIMIGADLFYNKNLHIDFENSNLKILEKYDDYLIDYTELKVINFSGKFFEIESNVNTTPVIFKIDTGNPYGALINTNTFHSIDLSTTNSLYINNELKLDHSIAEITFENEINQINVFHHPRTVNNLLGVDFMKNFNWIFDFNNGKVFAKKISGSFEGANYNRVVTRDNILLIESYNSPKYNINKNIVSVDGTQITEQNICYYKNLLNSTKNWDIYTLKTLKP